jgi:ATP-binding cassette subfamily B protein
VRDADLVLFLDHGRIIEMGTFDELSARDGRFASLLRTSGILAEEGNRQTAPALT